MSAILTARFGDPTEAHRARAANATFDRAIELKYSRVVAQAFAREARRDCLAWETAEETAYRLVRSKTVSATVPTTPRPAA